MPTRDAGEFRSARDSAAFVQLETFAAQIRDGLADANWDTRRAILRTLIKKVELGKETIRIVYKVSPRPFDQGPSRGPLQDCPRGVSGRVLHQNPAPYTPWSILPKR